MNYWNILTRSWGLIRRTKLLWLFWLFAFVEPLLGARTSNNMAIECALLLLICLSIYLSLFTLYGVTCAAAATLRGESLSLRAIWIQFESRGAGLLGILICITILYLGLMFFSAVLLGLINLLVGGAIADFTLRQSLALWAAALIINEAYYLSSYGFILRDLEVGQSAKYGLKVLVTNWPKCTVLFLFLNTPVYLWYIVRGSSLAMQRVPFTFKLYLLAYSSLPGQLGFAAIRSVVTLFSIVAFLLAYQEFKRVLGYPEPKPVSVEAPRE